LEFISCVLFFLGTAAVTVLDAVVVVGRAVVVVLVDGVTAVVVVAGEMGGVWVGFVVVVVGVVVVVVGSYEAITSAST
jgi:hypothetical protein